VTDIRRGERPRSPTHLPEDIPSPRCLVNSRGLGTESPSQTAPHSTPRHDIFPEQLTLTESLSNDRGIAAGILERGARCPPISWPCVSCNRPGRAAGAPPLPQIVILVNPELQGNAAMVSADEGCLAYRGGTLRQRRRGGLLSPLLSSAAMIACI